MSPSPPRIGEESRPIGDLTGRIFISHRREGSPGNRVTSGHTQLLYDQLTKRYGANHIYIDHKDMYGPEEWERRLSDALRNASVLVAVAEPGWRAEFDRRIGSGQRDWVTEEILEAHSAGVPIHGVTMGPGSAAKFDVPTAHDVSVVNDRQVVEINPKYPDDGFGILFGLLEEHIPWWFRRRNRRIVSVLLGLAVAALSFLGFEWLQDPELVDVRGGALVLPLVELGDDETLSAASGERSEAFRHAIAEDWGAQQISVSSDVPDSAFALTQPIPDEDQEVLEPIINESNASVVVSGAVRDRNVRRLTLDAWLGRVDGLEELEGESLSFLIADEVSVVKTNDEAQDDIKLAEKAVVALAPVRDVANALGALTIFNPQEAVETLDGLLVAEPDSAEWALLYHLRANAKILLDDFEGASLDYTRALEVDPGFERAAVGLADVGLLNALSAGCAPAASALLSDTITRFEALLPDATDDIAMKAQSGLGRTKFCLDAATRALIDPGAAGLNEARTHLATSLDIYEQQANPTSSQDETSFAAALSLGAVEEVRHSLDAASTAEIEFAIQQLEAKEDLTRRSWTQAQASWQLARLHRILGNGDLAIDAESDACATAQSFLQDLDLTADDMTGPVLGAQALVESLSC